MADQQVNVIVNVITKGQEKLKEVSQDLMKTGKTRDGHTAITTRANDVLSKNNVTLGQQIPLLRELNPVWGALGISWLAGATAIAGISAGAVMANQAFNSWLASTASLTMSFNTQTQSTWSYMDVVKELMSLHLDTGITMESLSNAMKILNAQTNQSGTSLDILTRAIKVHKDTHLPLIDVVTELGKAYHDGYMLAGQMIPAGPGAVNALIARMEEGADTSLQVKTKIDDEWSTTWESVKLSFGALVEIIKLGAIEVLKPLDLLVTAIQQFCIGDWEGAWGSLVSVASLALNPLSGVFSSLLDFIPDPWLTKLSGAVDFFAHGKWKTALDVLTTIVEAVQNPLGFALDQLTKLIKDKWPSISNLTKSLFGQITGATTEAGNTAASGAGSVLKSIGHFFGLQEGGRITTGGGVWVGERGPELLNLPAGAQVAPLDQGRSAGPNILQVYIGNELLSQFVIDDLNTAVRLRGGH